MSKMPAGLPVVIALFAQDVAAAAASHPVYGPASPTPKAPVQAPVAAAQRDCAAANSDPNAREIVVCALRPQGYRLDPDVMEARRLKKQGSAGPPHNPHETYADNSCATIGPMGCRGGPTINLLAAATTLATIADRLSKGQEVGSLFVTEPARSEYQLYVQAKKRREAKEADAAAKAKIAALQSAAQAKAAEPAAAQSAALIQKQ